jgi:hypothetical protein
MKNINIINKARSANTKRNIFVYIEKIGVIEKI